MDECLDGLVLHKKLMKHYKSYKMLSDILKIGDKKMWIITIYYKKSVILKAEYIIIGSYSKQKNIYIWGDQSNVLDKSMVELISEMRKKLLRENINDTFRKFLENDYTVISTLSLLNEFNVIASFTNEQIIMTTGNDIINIISVKKILFTNMED